MKKLFIIFILLLIGVGCKDQIIPLQTWSLHQAIYSVSFNDIDNKLALLTKDNVKLLSLFKNKNFEEYLSNEKIINGKILFDKDAIWIGGGNIKDGLLLGFNTSKGTSYRFNEEQYSEVYAISLLRDRNMLVTGHANGEIILWDLSTDRKKQNFGDYDSEVFSLAFSPDESKLYSGNGIGVVDIWDIASGQKIKSNKELDNSIFTLCIDKRNNTVIGGGGSGVLYIFDNNLSVQRQIMFNKEAVLSCDSQDNTGKIICGLTNGYVATSKYDGSDKKILKLHNDDVLYVEFIDKGEKIITVSKDGVIKLWDAETI